MCDSCLHWNVYQFRIFPNLSNSFVTNVMLVVCKLSHVILVCVTVCIIKRASYLALWRTQHDVDGVLATGYSPTCDQMRDSSIARSIWYIYMKQLSYRDGRGGFNDGSMRAERTIQG